MRAIFVNSCAQHNTLGLGTPYKFGVRNHYSELFRCDTYVHVCPFVTCFLRVYCGYERKGNIHATVYRFRKHSSVTCHTSKRLRLHVHLFGNNP